MRRRSRHGSNFPPDEFVYESGFACAALRAASCTVFRAGGDTSSRTAGGAAHGAAADTTDAAVTAAASASGISLHPEGVDQAFCWKESLALAVQPGKLFLWYIGFSELQGREKELIVIIVMVKSI